MGFFDRFRKKSLTPVGSMGNGWQSILVNEPFTGAWQQNQELKRTDLLAYHAVFACITLIASDIGKLRMFTKRLKDGVLQVIPSKATRIFKKPNNYQTWQQFSENWAYSKLTRGNTYALKLRDLFGDVYQLHILNPDRVKVLIADNGEVFYQISRDKLFNIDHDTIVPASEIVHDRYNCLYHPLIGLSPLTACAVSAGQGMAIQANATILFKNASRPSGILTTPGPISQEKVQEVKANWNKSYSGLQQGGIAVLGDGVTYQSISLSSEDTQMIEQLKLTAEVVCSVFHVPPFKIGLGGIPAGQKTGDLQEIYYADCLQHYIESMENLFDVCLDLEDGVEIEADLAPLIRMDSTSQMDYLTKGTGSGIISPNEARAKIGLPPVEGGDNPYMQQQNYSLEALVKRDNQDDPFNSKQTPQATDSTAKTVVNHYHQPTTTTNDSKSQNPASEVTDQTAKKPTFDNLYKGKFSDGESYRKGDFVSRNGGLWVCKCDSSGDWAFENWQLCSKNGGES